MGNEVMCLTSSISPPAVCSLARELGQPTCVCGQLEQAAHPALLESHAQICEALTDAAHARNAWQSLAAEFSANDLNGMRTLALYLAAACLTREKYHRIGIPDTVFIDTMACFTRFLREAYACGGSYVFDRGFWGWRQLSCLLFRLGTLEFEYRLLEKDEPVPPCLAPMSAVLSVHIPSDASLTRDALRGSYEQAKLFFANHSEKLCSRGEPLAVVCGSWLLSPALQALLPQSSGIYLFACDYDIYATEPDDQSFFRWLFDGKKPPAPLPQRTGLQRNVAQHLKGGGKIGSARGLKL